MKTILFFILFMGLKSIYPQDKVINTNRYLIINHKDGYNNMYQLYKSGDLILESKNDTTYLKNKVVDGWARYYDYTLKKFIPKDNGNKRIYPLKNTYTFNDSIIYDSEYSKYKVLSNKKEGQNIYYNCLDISEGTKESGQKCEIVVAENYIFIQYRTHTYIYSN